MNRRLIIAGAVFVIVGAIVLGLLQYVLRVQGAPLKLVIGVVAALIGGVIAWVLVKSPGQPAGS